jgi:hypothetical protein
MQHTIFSSVKQNFSKIVYKKDLTTKNLFHLGLNSNKQNLISFNKTKNITSRYIFGNTILKVNLLNNSNIYRDVYSQDLTCSQVILSNELDLFNENTLTRLNLKVTKFFLIAAINDNNLTGINISKDAKINFNSLDMCVNIEHLDLNVLKYLVELGFRPSRQNCYMAIIHNRIDLLTFLHENNLLKIDNNIILSIKMNDISSITFLRERGYAIS